MKIAVTLTAKEQPTLVVYVDAPSADAVTGDQISEALSRMIDAADVTESVFAEFMEEEGWNEDERVEVGE